MEQKKMEGKHQKENRLYCEKLSGGTQGMLYLEKMECVNGLDPYKIPTNELMSF